MADKFVRVRLVRIAGSDLSLFDFDFDLTWFCFFLTPDETVLGRYGGRDAKSDEGRISLAGLRFAMDRAISRHDAGTIKPATRAKPIYAEEYPSAKKQRGNGCIHCHQVNEFRRAAEKAAGTWTRDSLWAYPLPENIGITLDVDRGDSIVQVEAKSAAEAIGIKKGDVLIRLNEMSVASFADAQYALHRGPKAGKIPVEWRSRGDTKKGELTVVEGWRKTNITWRASLLDILPSFPVSGEDLTVEERKALKLPEGHAAFRQDKFVHSTLRAIGMQSGDVLVGINGRTVPGLMDDYLGYLRREHLVGDTITINVLRAGKPVDLKITLK